MTKGTETPKKPRGSYILSRLLPQLFAPPSNAGRPATRSGDEGLAHIFEWIRADYERRDGRKYGDDALLKVLRAEEATRKGIQQNNAKEIQFRKTMINRLSAARRRLGLSRKSQRVISGKK